MTGTERRQFEMLVRVRNFGNTHPSLFASSPAAQKTFEALGATIDELTITDGRKLSAKASARGDRKAVARRALKDLLRRISVLARNLSAEGRTMPAFELPRSKSDVLQLREDFGGAVSNNERQLRGFGHRDGRQSQALAVS